jgi:hypothetical protein
MMTSSLGMSRNNKFTENVSGSLRMSDQRFDLSRPFPLGVRVGLGIAGLACVALPAWEFRHAFLEPNLSALFFVAILIGAWSVGGLFIMGALFGESQAWRFIGGRLYVKRRSAFFEKSECVSGPDIERIDVREIESDDHPRAYVVSIRTKSGHTYESRDVQERAEAEALRKFVRAKLRIARSG